MDDVRGAEWGLEEEQGECCAQSKTQAATSLPCTMDQWCLRPLRFEAFNMSHLLVPRLEATPVPKDTAATRRRVPAVFACGRHK